MIISEHTCALAPKNHLLAALPANSLTQLTPHLNLVEMPIQGVLYRPDQRISHVYFPESGWVSMIAILEDGDAAEVGLIGWEGMVGIPVLLGTDHDDIEAMIQGPGTAYSLPVETLIATIDEDSGVREMFLRYVAVHHTQVSRTAACNGHHPIEQRLARWLLMAHDRSFGGMFPMTYEFLSMMLGAHRAGISVAMSGLQKAHFLRYERAMIEIVDRPGLESAACDCYGIVKTAYDRLWQGAQAR